MKPLLYLYFAISHIIRLFHTIFHFKLDNFNISYNILFSVQLTNPKHINVTQGRI